MCASMKKKGNRYDWHCPRKIHSQVWTFLFLYLIGNWTLRLGSCTCQSGSVIDVLVHSSRSRSFNIVSSERTQRTGKTRPLGLFLPQWELKRKQNCDISMHSKDGCVYLRVKFLNRFSSLQITFISISLFHFIYPYIHRSVSLSDIFYNI